MSCSDTEVTEGKVRVEARTVELQTLRTIGQQMNVNATASKDDWIALNGFHLLFGFFFCKEKCVFAVACDDSIKVRAHRYATLMMGNQFQVHAKVRVWEEIFENLTGFNFRFDFVFTISNYQRSVAVLQIVVQDFTCEARFVLSTCFAISFFVFLSYMLQGIER